MIDLDPLPTFKTACKGPLMQLVIDRIIPLAIGTGYTDVGRVPVFISRIFMVLFLADKVSSA